MGGGFDYFSATVVTITLILGGLLMFALKSFGIISDVITRKTFYFVFIAMMLLIGWPFEVISFICYSIYRGIRILLGKGDSGKYVPLTFVVVDENSK